MNKSLERLIKHKDVVLKAEIAARLHNLGKLEPVFWVVQTGESPDVLGHLYRIRGQYSFRRFCKPVILRNDFPYEDLVGVLYCVDLTLRKQQAELETSIIKIQEEIQSSTGEEKKHRGQEFANLKKQKEQIDKKIQEEEKEKWLIYEQNFDNLVIPLFNWSLGALLTLFWDRGFIEKPGDKLYVPGNDDDPDYHRRPKQEVVLQNGYTMELPTLLALCHGEVSGQEKKGLTSEGRYSSDKIGFSKSVFKKLFLSSPFGYENIKPDWESWPEKKTR